MPALRNLGFNNKFTITIVVKVPRCGLGVVNAPMNRNHKRLILIKRSDAGEECDDLPHTLDSLPRKELYVLREVEDHESKPQTEIGVRVEAQQVNEEPKGNSEGQKHLVNLGHPPFRLFRHKTQKRSNKNTRPESRLEVIFTTHKNQLTN